MKMDTYQSSVIKVGHGRGFIVERFVPFRFGRKTQISRSRVVITAAHCLPRLPPAHVAAYNAERSYANLLGRLADKKNSVWAYCMFVDPVSDIAILGPVDDQELSQEADAFDSLTENVTPFRIAPARSGRGYVLSLGSPRWLPITLNVLRAMGGSSLAMTNVTQAGMSGSLILNYAGHAVGVVVIGGGSNRHNEGPQAFLTRNLPGWLLEERVKP
jgi:hypothetical protein